MTLNTIIRKFKIKGFIEDIKTQLSEYNGKLILKTSINKSNTDGEFSEVEMVIRCFVDYSSSYWIGVLAHEYAHFLQCINGSKLWTDFQEKVFEHIDDIEKALHSKKAIIDKKTRKKIAKYIIRMELDCDKSAVKIINKYKLPVNKIEYCSKANIVLYKYVYWAEHGIWPIMLDKKTGKTPDWKSFKISKLMHEDDYKSIKNIPIKLLSAFESL